MAHPNDPEELGTRPIPRGSTPAHLRTGPQLISLGMRWVLICIILAVIIGGYGSVGGVMAAGVLYVVGIVTSWGSSSAGCTS